MAVLTVALLQLVRSGADSEGNLAIGEAACRRARAAGADIAVFPEMWSNGYRSNMPQGSVAGNVYRHPQRWGGGAPAGLPAHAVWQGEALTAASPFVAHFRALAAELELAIALTYLEQWDGAPRNSVSIIDRRGRCLLTQAKVHTCAFDPAESGLTPGEGFGVCTLDTAAGEVEVGAMICFDREFPESARALMLAGAEIVLVPNACDMDVNRLDQLRVRAMENMVGVAMANYAGAGMGHSAAFDGIAYGPAGSRNMLVVEAGEAGGIFPAVFDLDALRETRRREVWGNAFRRPSAYGTLADSDVRDPFIRVGRDGSRVPR
jgi:N-carbamoylputrescine amidase